MGRCIGRTAALKEGMAEFTEELKAAEAEREAYAQDEQEESERIHRLEQEEIFRDHPTSDYNSLEEWQAALRDSGYFLDSKEYQAVVKNPDDYFTSDSFDGHEEWMALGYPFVVPVRNFSY